MVYEKPTRSFAYPYGKHLALERELIRLRAYEITLVFHYKETIERRIIDQIYCHDKQKSEIDSNFKLRAPKEEKGLLKKISQRNDFR